MKFVFALFYRISIAVAMGMFFLTKLDKLQSMLFSSPWTIIAWLAIIGGFYFSIASVFLTILGPVGLGFMTGTGYENYKRSGFRRAEAANYKESLEFVVCVIPIFLGFFSAFMALFLNMLKPIFCRQKNS